MRDQLQRLLELMQFALGAEESLRHLIGAQLAPLDIAGWADLVTLACLAIMWTYMLVLEIRRTWRWERLGLALTLKTAALAATYGLGASDILLRSELLTPSVRWFARAMLFGIGCFVIIVMRFDRPDSFDDND